jgi:hypothetical protein
VLSRKALIHGVTRVPSEPVLDADASYPHRGGLAAAAAAWRSCHPSPMAKRSEKRARVVANLQGAKDSRQLIKLVRGFRGADDLDGYVMEIGERWLVMANLDGAITIDGSIAVRLADVVGVVPNASEDFVRRALELHGEWPPAGPTAELKLGRTRDLIQSIAACNPLVTLHIERDDPDVCLIGVPTAFTKHKIKLLHVNPKATWRKKPRAWRLARITRIDYGARYERALHEVAGSAPANRMEPADHGDTGRVPKGS